VHGTWRDGDEHWGPISAQWPNCGHEIK